MCSPIPKGCLGVSDLLMFNGALLRKWLQRNAYEESLWRVAMDLNMVVNGVGGALMKLMDCPSLVFGNSLGGVEGSFQSIQDLR